MTYGESLDWLFAAVERKKIEIENMKYQAWFNGIAFNRAYVAAKDPAQPYPAFNVMFPVKDISTDTNAIYAAEREELGMILAGNMDRKPPERE